MTGKSTDSRFLGILAELDLSAELDTCINVIEAARDALVRAAVSAAEQAPGNDHDAFWLSIAQARLAEARQLTTLLRKYAPVGAQVNPLVIAAEGLRAAGSEGQP